ncbi:phasin family protein [Salisaeta longa]|uniref:phasin family protein n=1 Tax=Salisaeta longa TaxID=503170 RepID=UPI0003B5BBC2|nr:phasin family protein [Salisaeta longa]
MSTQETKQKQTNQLPQELSNVTKELSGRAREVWLAGLGALSRLEEEGDKVFKSLVERGKTYEGKRRNQIDDVANDLRKQQETISKNVTESVNKTTETVSKAVNETLTGALGRLGVPTRDEVQGLSEKVGALSKKLDDLSALLDAQAAAQDATTTVYHVIPHEDGWAVKRESAEQAAGVYDTKKEAVDAARSVAKKHAPSELIVHKQDRSVQETFSYDGDDA